MASARAVAVRGNIGHPRNVYYYMHEERMSLMAYDYIELFLKCRENGDTRAVNEWVRQHGLSAATMKSGLLLSGDRKQVEKAFSVSLEDIQPPTSLPVPEELRDHVESITVPRPRSYHG
jgi:hypothetical protein